MNNLSALDNVAMALELSGTNSTEAEQLAAEALTKVGLEDRMHHIPDQLSGGQQQRALLLVPLLETGHYYWLMNRRVI